MRHPPRSGVRVAREVEVHPSDVAVIVDPEADAQERVVERRRERIPAKVHHRSRRVAEGPRRHARDAAIDGAARPVCNEPVRCARDLAVPVDRIGDRVGSARQRSQIVEPSLSERNA